MWLWQLHVEQKMIYTVCIGVKSMLGPGFSKEGNMSGRNRKQKQEFDTFQDMGDVDDAIRQEEKEDAKALATEATKLKALGLDTNALLGRDDLALDAAAEIADAAAAHAEGAKEELMKIPQGLLKDVNNRIRHYDGRWTKGSLEQDKKRFLLVIKNYLEGTDTSVTMDQINAICAVGRALFSPAAQSEFRFGSEVFSEEQLKRALDLPHTHCHSFFTRFRVLCDKEVTRSESGAQPPKH